MTSSQLREKVVLGNLEGKVALIEAAPGYVEPERTRKDHQP